MATIFTKIIQGEIPSYKVAEDDRYYAFLDINPLTTGHTLVMTKTEEDYLLDLDDDTYMGMWVFTKKLGLAVESIVPCQRIGLVVLGLEVPHAHIHIVPINNEGDVNFKKQRVNMSPEEFTALASQISKKFEELG